MPDDAAVYKLNDDQVIIVTTDFFTPVVDTPYDYGAIAAANALSDVYAMGGRPVLALNIVAFPDNLIDSMLPDLLMGAAEKVRESGAVIAGGHTIKDKEPKAGLAVVGIAHPDHLLEKGGAKPGDALYLTKPVGSGTITTANKNDKLVDRGHLETAIRWMNGLNRAASEAAVAVRSKAATDITGFGLLGHAVEMAESSGVTLHFYLPDIPMLPGVDHYADEWIFPGGSAENMNTFEGRVRADDGLDDGHMMLLYDAQTSGGLLVAVPAGQDATFEAEIAARGGFAWRVGAVAPAEDDTRIVVHSESQVGNESPLNLVTD